LRARGFHEARVFVLVGDAELDEGSNHEAMAFAGAVGLANLNVVVADNDSASLGWRGGIAAHFDVHGWSSTTADMQDHGGLYRAVTAAHPDRPHVTVAVSRS
jgi:transketolase